jgi:hypothetical protein
MTPDSGRANPVRFGSRVETDATRLHAGPFDTGRTRSGVALDGAELPHYFRTTIAFAQQLAPPIAATDAGVCLAQPSAGRPRESDTFVAEQRDKAAPKASSFDRVVEDTLRAQIKR